MNLEIENLTVPDFENFNWILRLVKMKFISKVRGGSSGQERRWRFVWKWRCFKIKN